MPRLSTRAFAHRVDIMRPARVADGQGGWTETAKTLVVRNLPCRLTDTKLANRIDENGQLRADITRTLYAAPGAAINSGDTVMVGGVAWLVQTADEQPDAIYRKAYLLAEQQ